MAEEYVSQREAEERRLVGNLEEAVRRMLAPSLWSSEPRDAATAGLREAHNALYEFRNQAEPEEEALELSENPNLDDGVVKSWREFWRDIVAPDGMISMQQIKKELHDYYRLMCTVSEVYAELTNGQLTKPNTDPRYIIGYAQENYEEAAYRDVLEDVQAEVLRRIGDEGDREGVKALVVIRNILQDRLGVPKDERE